ncbi:MAG: di-heme oxidoredictase family protein, partial [Bacteroidota bacterium]
SNQTIRPFTDMLLHDMGPELADGRPDHEATGAEWRTPPLWGIGLFEVVNGHTNYLHDGRARNLSEAILWHAGEALEARENYRQLSADERAALEKFLNSL